MNIIVRGNGFATALAGSFLLTVCANAGIAETEVISIDDDVHAGQ
ncbi:MAG: hypothetical protein ACR2RE_31465 [Geminicoccaceae bacterium]